MQRNAVSVRSMRDSDIIRHKYGGKRSYILDYTYVYIYIVNISLSYTRECLAQLTRSPNFYTIFISNKSKERNSGSLVLSSSSHSTSVGDSDFA